MNAREVMTKHEIWACGETSTVREVAKMMDDHNIGSIPVLDPDGRLEGIVTDRDLCCKALAENLSPETPIRRVMSTPVQSVHPDANLQEIELRMRQYKVRRIPVVDDDEKLQGFISTGDLACHCGTIEQEHELVGVLQSVCAAARP